MKCKTSYFSYEMIWSLNTFCCIEMDVEGLYWNKINVLIDIVLIGGVGGRGLGVTVFPSYFYLKKIGKKRIIIYSLSEGRKPLIDQFCWTCNEREFYTIIWKCGPVSNWSSSGSQSYFKGQLMRGMCSHRLMFC